MADAQAELGHYRRAAPDASVTLTWEGRRLTLTPGPGEGVLRITDEAGKSREVALNGKPVTLAQSLTAQPRTLTLTAISGDVGIDALAVR